VSCRTSNVKLCDAANLVLGALLFSPWLLGFQESITAITVHVIVGALVAILAAIEIWVMSENPPRLTASR
jgi:hypothetical protein